MINLKKITKKSGLPPGSLVYTGKKDVKTKITLIEFDKDTFNEKFIEDCPVIKNENTIKWVKVNGFSQVDTIKKIGKCFNLHPLVMEDILNTHQRPKIEDYNDYLYLVLKLFDNEKEGRIHTKQISLILENNLVITFQDDNDKIFDVILKRLKSDSPLRKRGADYLLYSLIDTVIDSYFLDLEALEDRIELIEEDLIENVNSSVLQRIHTVKIDIITLRKAIWPLREMLRDLESHEYSLIDESTNFYLRDVYDHSMHVFETLESFRDRISEMLDIYLSSTSNRLNEIVRVLTIISTIFVPLTFIVGLYGMNFRFMPEIDHPYSYPIVIVGMLLIALSMLFYFKRKKWI
ncbi:magnesium/cobalt transporter CorA [Methanobacterium sp. ACI-7]|uniref:magnesium/cobalt transporter CorA n=1 Tax=unclassified Methanobacterium TaxID=2627676 RepID=UPI0039C0EBDF